jgi:hypothetical protein
LSRDQKAKAINDRLAKTGGSLDPSDIAALYRNVVDPGLRPKVEHALNLCIPDHVEYFMKQCYDHEPADRGLYAIRNAINHGTVDVNDPETAMIFAARFPELSKLVFLMVRGVLLLNIKVHLKSQTR